MRPLSAPDGGGALLGVPGTPVLPVSVHAEHAGDRI